MENLSCCFTGHRNLPAERIYKIVMNLDHAIENAIADGLTNFISGGALGFDQIATSMIVAKKEMGGNIRLIFVLPCKNQDALWDEPQRALYQNLLKEADEIIYVSEQYDSLCMKRRNKYMIDHSVRCICALIREKSGTGQTVRYVRKKGIRIINVAR